MPLIDENGTVHEIPTMEGFSSACRVEKINLTTTKKGTPWVTIHLETLEEINGKKRKKFINSPNSLNFYSGSATLWKEFLRAIEIDPETNFKASDLIEKIVVIRESLNEKNPERTYTDENGYEKTVSNFEVTQVSKYEPQFGFENEDGSPAVPQEEPDPETELESTESENPPEDKKPDNLPF